jgi:uncharacterized C2H2 Zn-finger protein
MKEIYKSDIEIEAIQLTEENKTEILNFIPESYNPTITRDTDNDKPLYLKFKKYDNTLTAIERDYIAKINKEIFVIPREVFENTFFKKNNYLKKELKCKSCGKIFKTLKDIQCHDSESTYFEMKYEDGQIIYHKKGTIKSDFQYSCPICGTFLDIKGKDIPDLLK